MVNTGGKQDSTVHLVLADSGERLRVSATEEPLAGEKGNQLYTDVTLRVHAEQHLRTGALRELRLIEFLPQDNQVDELALAALWEKGRDAWRGVKSATGWVEEMRGAASLVF